MHEDQVLRMALACIRWNQFGECRTDGWPGLPPTAADTVAALEASLAKPQPVGGKSQYMHGGTTFDEFDHMGFARAIIATLSAPVAQPGEAERCNEWGNVSADCICAAETHHATPIAAQPAAVEPHSDDLAVDRFAAAMKAKLAKQRAKGYGGWKTCPVERLQEMLFAHVTKGDPVDVANFAMMLSSRDASTARAAPSQAAAVPEAVERDAARADPWAILHRQLCMKPDRCSECDRIAALSQGDVSGEGEGS